MATIAKTLWSKQNLMPNGIDNLESDIQTQSINFSTQGCHIKLNLDPFRLCITYPANKVAPGHAKLNRILSKTRDHGVEISDGKMAGGY